MGKCFQAWRSHGGRSPRYKLYKLEGCEQAELLPLHTCNLRAPQCFNKTYRLLTWWNECIIAFINKPLNALLVIVKPHFTCNLLKMLKKHWGVQHGISKKPWDLSFLQSAHTLSTCPLTVAKLNTSLLNNACFVGEEINIILCMTYMTLHPQ